MGESNYKNTNNIFLSCDWGTSNFRLKLAELRTGKVLNNLTTNVGIKRIHSEWLEENNKTNRIGYFLNYLRSNIAELECRIERSLKDIPLIISGMASSNLGLKELPYASLPLDINPSRLNVFIKEANHDFPHRLLLISGIKTENDVIRGEETQIFALAAEYAVDKATIILPGTHSKHIFVRNNKIIDFKTYITGELFELLTTHSILKDSIFEENDTIETQVFLKGVEESAKENILHSLFKIRAYDILGKAEKAENIAFLSGLLIGLELRKLKNIKINRLILAGEGKLQAYYANALSALDIEENVTILSDREIKDLTVKGHRLILQHI